MKNLFLLYAGLAAVFFGSTAFCGFYVAQADADLFNETSQVIIVRDQGRTSITMASDFEGDVKEFAMVVPVPVVLKQDQIRIADAAIFDKLDAYSGPRLVEYFDSNPCERRRYRREKNMAVEDMAMPTSADESASALGVTIEERYTVGEYDILILSAKESRGLEIWLKANGYKIPEQAGEVLEPYIKNKVKFFVAKVNLGEYEASGKQQLSPLQMTFDTEKFMLPIRLGMANANGDQDLVVYAFARDGRIETTNYRMKSIPTDLEIPEFVEEKFGEFYRDLFSKAWEEAGKNVVFTEYAWDLSSSNYLKCDPCASDPPFFADLQEAGIFWLEDGRGGNSDYEGDLFMTRLHVRYNRSNFPQDLQFQITPNRRNFQGRYVMNRPARGSYDCSKGRDYLQKLVLRRQDELKTLARYTGWEVEEYQYYVDGVKELLPNSMRIKSNNKGELVVQDTAFRIGEGEMGWLSYLLLGMALMGFIVLVVYALRNKKSV